MFVWFLILYEKKSSITGSLVFALWYSDGLRRKRSALRQHYTNFTKVNKNKGSAFFSISDKSVPYLTLTSFPGVSMASVGQEGSPSPASLLLHGTPRWPKGRPTAHGSSPSCALLTPSFEVNPQRTTNCYPVCVCFGHKRVSLPFITKWSTWLRCDIIALWESLPWKCLGFSEAGCMLVCVCTTC